MMVAYKFTNIFPLLCICFVPSVSYTMYSNYSNHEKFLVAAATGNLDLIKNLLFVHKVDIDYVGQDGTSALIWATKMECVDAVQLLINYNANVHLQNDWGVTALHWAADNGNQKIFSALINAGAQTDVRDCRGATPYMWAKRTGNLKLFDAFFNQQQQDEFGKSI